MRQDYQDYLTATGLGLNASDTPDSTPGPAASDTPEEIGAPSAADTPDAADATKASSSSTPPSPRDRALALAVRGLGAARTGWLWLWAHRPKLPLTLYALVFIIITATAVVILQLGVYAEPTENQLKDQPDLPSVAQQVTTFFSNIWLHGQRQALGNMLILAIVYGMLTLVINRFWFATALFGALVATWSAANHFKVALRSEPIIPSDLSFIASGNTGSILSFLTRRDMTLIAGMVRSIAVFIAVCLVLQLLDRRNGLIPVHWRLRIIKTAPVRHGLLIATRLTAALASIALTIGMMVTFNANGSWTRTLAQETFSDTPMLWNTLDDARTNGTAAAFLRLAHAKTMEKPKSYSRETMEAIGKRYNEAAARINANRHVTLTDNTVIVVLSESFSDPNRVPGIRFSLDPMPDIRAIKESTTSGLMLAPGYGGGTANVEYQTLTGLSMANFDPLLQTPYQQSVPRQNAPFAFNQLWNAAHGKTASTAIHPYLKNMYLRDVNYRKFGFNAFLTLDSDPTLTHQEHEGNDPYVSDAAAYQSVLDQLDAHHGPQFIQLTTMQNHAGYEDWYPDNEFKQADESTHLDDAERLSVDTYAKGMSLTDRSTQEFLDALDHYDRPITVIFYGDHLPGIYSTASAHSAGTMPLHETDYFIWSNAASVSHAVKLDDAAYSSSNFFMSQAAEHMNAQVSPYLAFLTELHEAVPAISRVVETAGGFGEGSATYLNADGTPINPVTLDRHAQQLLDDYTLIQYDMTVGKGYLAQLGFTELP